MSNKYIRTSDLSRLTGHNRAHLARLAAKRQIPGVTQARKKAGYRYELTTQLEQWITERRQQKGKNGWRELSDDEFSLLGRLEAALSELEAERFSVPTWKYAKLMSFRAVLQRAVKLERYLSGTLSARRRAEKR